MKERTPRVAGVARPTPSARTPFSWSRIVDWLSAVVPVLAVLTALAVWFGFQIVGSRMLYFGIDPSVLEFGTRDFVLRSVAAVLRPMVYLLLGTLALVQAHLVVTWLLRRYQSDVPWRRSLRAAAWVLVAGGIVAFIQGAPVFTGEYVTDFSFGTDCQGETLGTWWRPGVLPLGVALMVYASWLLRRLSVIAPGSPPAWHRLVVAVTASLLLVGTFWSFSLYAHAAGALESHSYTCDGFRQFANVVVYSKRPLSIPELDGLVVEPVGDVSSKYHWRYTGLRLLLRSGDTYFLLPEDWRG